MPVLNLGEFIETLKRDGFYDVGVGRFIVEYAGKEPVSIYFVPSKEMQDDLKKDNLRMRFAPNPNLLDMLRKD